MALKALIISFCISYACISLAADQSFDDQTNFNFKDISCESESSPDCYQQMYCNIYEHLSISSCEEHLSSISSSFEGIFNGYSIYRLNRQKANTVFVTIHGLWGNAIQFREVMKKRSTVSQDTRYSTIELTHPGHLKVTRDDEYKKKMKKNPPFAKHEEWMSEVENALKIANQIADNVVIIGHSTGGLLAIGAAIEFPDLVDSIVLVEPAVKVRALNNFGACVGSKVLPRFLLKGLGSIIGTPLPDGVSVKMGCEVQKLADHLFHNTNNTDPQNRYKAVAARIKVPVLLINNERDNIVSAEDNRNFFESLKVPKKYVSINDDDKMNHGLVTSQDPSIIADNIMKFMHHYFPESNLGKIFLFDLSRKINSYLSIPCSEKQSLAECEGKFQEQIKTLNTLKLELCDVLKTPEKCSSTASAFDGLYGYYSYILHQNQYADVKSVYRSLNQMSEQNHPRFQEALTYHELLKSFRDEIYPF